MAATPRPRRSPAWWCTWRPTRRRSCPGPAPHRRRRAQPALSRPPRILDAAAAEPPESLVELVLFLPQMRLSFGDLVDRARAAEAAASPASWAWTTSHRRGRRPADVRGDGHEHVVGGAHAAPADRLAGAVRRLPAPCRAGPRGGVRRPPSGGRFELGIGWDRARRARRLRHREHRAGRARGAPARDPGGAARLWAGETVDYDGRFHHLHDVVQRRCARAHPRRDRRVGRRTLALVRDFADWCRHGAAHGRARGRGRASGVRVAVGGSRNHLYRRRCGPGLPTRVGGGHGDLAPKAPGAWPRAPGTLLHCPRAMPGLVHGQRRVILLVTRSVGVQPVPDPPVAMRSTSSYGQPEHLWPTTPVLGQCAR